MDGIFFFLFVLIFEFSWIRMLFVFRNVGIGVMLGFFWRFWILRFLGSLRWEGFLIFVGEVKDLLELEVVIWVCCSFKVIVFGMLLRIYWNIYILVEIVIFCIKRLINLYIIIILGLIISINLFNVIFL